MSDGASRFGTPPPIYRSLVKWFHWTSFGLVIAVMIAGVTPVTKWGFGLVAAGWIAGFGAYGVLGKPGPALTGAVRTAFIPMHIGMYLLVAGSAIAVLSSDYGDVAGITRVLCLAMIGAGSLHGVFHLWRHTALGDGALRNMTPRLFHGVL